MSINFKPKVGQVLDCNYGVYPKDTNGCILDNIVDAHMPPEMVKRRLVIVLNGKLNGNSSIVVPLSTTLDEIKLKRGFHVQLDAGVIEDLKYFPPKTCWAKCDMVQTVSNRRLNKPMLAGRGWLSQCIPVNIITLIQQAILNSIKSSENLLM
ncbi:type II toxin-antitoxin system PemK/MazF family toxin [Rahnella sikkimica]|uniref:Growth inhibitor PemK n=1 Tax=Rahnella sikkimica TaxID=1805933 RepID=A0A2L1ULN7_9GAMM|nr:type II toxin-antitoxin system PemK/MazF family toxin [Rahnella sikkimica]AVF33847.1 hypothetical protein BV494_02370 [Rahnella sikkimica]